jgi:hypothetical protein
VYSQWIDNMSRLLKVEEKIAAAPRCGEMDGKTREKMRRCVARLSLMSRYSKPDQVGSAAAIRSPARAADAPAGWADWPCTRRWMIC